MFWMMIQRARKNISLSPLGQLVFYFTIKPNARNDHSFSFTKAVCAELGGVSLVSLKPVVGKEWNDFKRKVYGSVTASFPFLFKTSFSPRVPGMRTEVCFLDLFTVMKSYR